MQTSGMDRYLKLVRDSIDPEHWKAIAANPGVLNAHEAVVRLTKDEPGKNHFGATTRLLNQLSIAVFDVSRDARSVHDRDHALIFCANHDTQPHGDIVDTKVQPNYPSYIGTRAELEAASKAADHVRELSWGELVSVADQSWKRDGEPMLPSSLFTLKRYRHDLPTVYGFSIYCGRIQLSHVSAAGIWSSRHVEISSIEPWIAFVVLVYQAYDQRDRRLVYNAQQVDFTRWDFRDADTPSDEQEPITLAPFYLRKPFGPTTFAAFQVPPHPDTTAAFCEHEVQGVWKSSWHAEDASKERALLDRLHSGGWIPGLVRPYPASEAKRLVVPTPVDIFQHAAADARAGEEPAAQVDAQLPANGQSGPAPPHAQKSDGLAIVAPVGGESLSSSNGQAFPSTYPGDADNVETLQQEIIHLASIGEPLSQCGSPRELLHVAYDLLETHLHVWEEGFLHRDLSWFNVLCKPKHFNCGDKGEKQRPCIQAILHDLGAGDAVDSARKFESSVLLIDLDNTICQEDLDAEAEKGDRPLVGTPGFMAFELQCPAEINEPEDWTGGMWKGLFEALDVEGLPHGADVVSRAFPDGDGGFLDKLRKVHELELFRDCADWKPHVERPVHNLRHDAESVFWIFFVAFLRAQPRFAKGEDRSVNRYATAYRAVLAQCPGLRERFLFQSHNTYKVFHSALAAFEGLFQAIGFYFNIPWHLYEAIVTPDHAHVALRRMILRWLLKVDPAVLDVALDTECPRPLSAKPPGPEEGDHNAGGAQREAPRPIVPTMKRKASGHLDDDRERVKRAADEDILRLAPGSIKEGVKVPGLRPVQKERPLAQAAKEYRHDLHAHLRSAYALRLKVWKDRERWFGNN